MHIDLAPSATLLSAALHYRDDCGWVVHPLHGPNEGTEKERGKKPKLTGWKKLEFFDCDDPFLEKHFGGLNPANLGVVVKPPHVVIDLDSKKDDGESVRAWLADQPSLAQWPRERTGGGCHLHIRCEDVPAEAIEAAGRNQKLTATVADGVSAEIFFGGNVVLAPSVHKSGHRYQWEVTGEIPVIAWAQLEQLFFSQQPVQKTKPRKGTRQRKEPPFWARYRGDLKTLDIVGLARHLGIYGQPLCGEEGKHTVRCPWRDQHSDASTPWNPGDSSTVIWQGRPPSLPSFFCSHITHGEKTLADFLNWAESREKGIVDRFCREQRLWEPDDLTTDPPASSGSKKRPRVVLPGAGRLESEFAQDVGLVMGRRKAWFNKGPLVVEIRRQRERVKVRVRDTRDTDQPAPAKYIEFTGFVLLRANRAITSLEEHIEPGILVRTEGPEDGGPALEFVPKSMNNKQAAVLIESDPLMNQLPDVERILDVPLPVIDPDTGKLTFPRKGHDPRFNSFLVENAPDLEEIPLEEAKAILHEILQDFCFKTERDLIHAIAAVITPFCRGLFDRWTSRTPVFFYRANRPRAGKDYLAGVVGLIFEGRTNEDAPLTSDTDETRKKITSSLISGRRRIHFSNCAGFIRNDVFEQIVTNERWSDRTLGSNQEVTIPNEIEFSLSGNTGVSYTPDFAARTRIIALHFEEEHENQRTFSRTDLHGWVLENRARILSAIWSLVRHWDACGRPAGPTPFTSFPSWAEVVGGIMHACDLGDPCLPDEDAINLGGDSETRDMKGLYALAYAEKPERWLSKKEVRELVLGTDAGEDAEPLFAWLDLDTKSGQITFGKIVEKYIGRIFEDVRLIKDSSSSKSQRHRLKFTADKPEKGPRNFVDKVFGNLSTKQSVSNAQHAQSDRNIVQIASQKPSEGGHNGHVGHVPIPGREFGNAKVVSSVKNKTNNFTLNIKNKNNDLYNRAGDMPNMPNMPTWQLVTDSGELEDIAEEIALADHPVGLDLETFGTNPLNPRRSNIRFLQLSLPWRPVWLIDLQATGYDLGGLGGVIESSELVIHNARFDLGFLAHHLGLYPQRVFCTLTASRLLSAGTRQSNALGDVLRRYGIADLSKDQGNSDWGAMLLTDEQLAYAAADVAHLHTLRERLEQELEKARLADVWAMETGLISIVARMEANGFTVDRSRLEEIRDDFRSQAKAFGQQVQDALGTTINPGSPEQLRDAFRAAGIGIDSTAEAILAELSHPAAALTLSMRGAEKTAQQAQSLLDAMEADGRIHAQFDPTGTEAGRFSSKRPNLQNIGRGPLRGCFIAPEGRTLVCADYSQIELRVAAALAGETRMIEAYESGADLHRRTAALVLGKTEDEVTKDDRQLAKAVNFGLLYGQSAGGLVNYAKTSYGVDLTEGEAERIRDKFFRAYRGLAQWHGRMRDMAKGDTFRETRTRLGRRRLMPQGSDQFWQRFSGGLNTPVQGGAADGLKKALILLASRLPAGAAILSTVHDEIIVECPADQADSVARTMEDAMRQAMAGLYPEIPIEVEAHTGTTWAEAK